METIMDKNSQPKSADKAFSLRNPFSRFNITGDKTLFSQIVADMQKNGGSLAPSNHWNWNLGNQQATEYTDELYKTKYSNLQMMLDPWIGCTGMQSLSESVIEKYKLFLKDIDHLNLMPSDILTYSRNNDWRETDLGSIMDINLITTGLEINQKNKMTLCEVGGGYGRLAETFLSSLSHPVHYVLIDAVPGSLMYAYLYLKSQFPERHIGFYYHGDAYSQDFDCYILPAWRSDLLAKETFDVCINIESMQEMAQHHIDHYFSLFDQITKQNGLIYLSNAHDYIFKGTWNYPRHWETMMLHNTPRSWSPNHPTHILYKREKGDFSLKRKILEATHQQHQTLVHQKEQTCIEQQNIISQQQIAASQQEKIIVTLTLRTLKIDKSLIHFYMRYLRKFIKKYLSFKK